MARNGSGGYTQPVADFVSGDVASATTMNTWLDDLGAEIANSLAADGQTPATANLPMGGFKHTNVAAAASRTDYARADQVLNSSLIWGGTAGGTTTAITISTTPAPSAYAAGQFFLFLMGSSACGASPTLNVSSLGAKSIFKADTGAALIAGDIPANAVVAVVYDGTQFLLLNVPLTLRLIGMVLGTGDGTDTTGSGSIRGANASGTDKAGGTVLIKGGQGTGSGLGGRVTIQTATAGSTGSSANALANALDIDSAQAIQTGNASAAAGYISAGDITLPAARGVRAKNTCKAWASFNGVTSITVRDSFNLTPTRNATGDYTCTFTNAMTDANYAVVVSAGTSPCFVVLHFNASSVEVAPTTSAFRFIINNNNNNAQIDQKYIHVAVYGL
jgi:hypothetical protein